MMPCAEGTSGAPVFDEQGRLVGIVSTAPSFFGTDGSPMVHVVSGDIVTRLIQGP
jgi:hypothetical protein